MALVLHLGGVGECMRLIWEWSVHGQASGDLQLRRLSFLADTKSNERTLNLCFTMPVTFYFYKKFCTDSWFENEGHALTFWQKYCFGHLLSAQKVYSREQDLARNST